MRFYRYAVWAAVFGTVILLFILVAPKDIFILEWRNGYLHAGILFPVLLLSWVFYTLALAFNFIYIEQLHMSYYKPVRRRKKFFPAMLCLPAFLSFIWLCYQFCKGM